MVFKKIETANLEGAEKEFADNYNTLVDALSEAQKNNATKEEVTKLQGELDAAKDKIDGITKLQKTVDELKNDIETKGSEAPKTPVQAIVDEIKALGVNNMNELKAYLAKNGKQSLEIKAITAIASSANTDYIGRTNLDTSVNWTPIIRNAFIGRFRQVQEMSDKSRFGYTEGTYTSNAGYVGEGTGNANSDAASAAAAFMDYAKIQAVLSVNTEVYEDIPDFAQGLVNQMTVGLNKFADTEIYSGDGLAPADVQHIKGILAYATEFANADYNDTVEKANEADAVAAVKSHIASLEGNYMADLCFMNPVDLFRLERLKDTTGQPIINKDLFGNPTISGLTIVPTGKVTDNTMVIMDSNVAEIRTKRSMKLQMGQILANDVLNDKQSAVLSTRVQFLIRNLDTAAVVKVSDVSALVQAIDIKVA